MKHPEHETIQATAREATMYAAGETIGTAKGLSAAATMFEGVQQLYAGVPQDVPQWMEVLAKELEQLAAKGRGRDHKHLAALATNVRGMATVVQERHGLVAKWLGDCAANVQHVAGQKREEFAKQLAAIPHRPPPVESKATRALAAALEALRK